MKSRRPKAKITPSDLQAQAAKLIADGTMPDLKTLFDVVGQIRAEYQPKFVEARRRKSIW